MPVEEVWEAYGGFLMQYTMETGWDELLRAIAPDLQVNLIKAHAAQQTQGFLDNLDNLHYYLDNVVYHGHNLKGPSFSVIANDDASLTLHYHSKRNGLYPIVKGVIREVARRIFDVEVIMKVTERKQEESDDGRMNEHVVFNIAIVSRYGIRVQRSVRR